MKRVWATAPTVCYVSLYYDANGNGTGTTAGIFYTALRHTNATTGALQFHQPSGWAYIVVAKKIRRRPTATESSTR